MRKRLDELTLADLRRAPVWLCESEGATDYVREAPPDIVLSDVPSMPPVVVLTEFEFADGSKHHGFSSPVDNSGLDYVQPVVVTSRGHVPMFFDTPPTSTQIAELLRRVDRTASQVFPAQYRSAVDVDGSKPSGVIESFKV